MNKIFEYIMDTFTILGCARAAAELARMGNHEAAKRLILESNSIKERRQQAKNKEISNVAHPVLR